MQPQLLSQQYTIAYCHEQNINTPISIILLIWLFCKEEDYWMSCTNVLLKSNNKLAIKQKKQQNTTKIYGVLTTNKKIYPNSIYIWSLKITDGTDVKFGIYVKNKYCMLF